MKKMNKLASLVSFASVLAVFLGGCATPIVNQHYVNKEDTERNLASIQGVADDCAYQISDEAEYCGANKRFPDIRRER